VSVSFVARPDWDRAEVAYAVNRKVANAVRRNLLRRRMRAIVTDVALPLPAGAYLVRSGPTGPSLDFQELKVAMSQAIEKATSGVRSSSELDRRRSTGVAQ
jgi:ribonuclease P protein component